MFLEGEGFPRRRPLSSCRNAGINTEGIIQTSSLEMSSLGEVEGKDGRGRLDVMTMIRSSDSGSGVEVLEPGGRAYCQKGSVKSV